MENEENIIGGPGGPEEYNQDGAFNDLNSVGPEGNNQENAFNENSWDEGLDSELNAGTEYDRENAFNDLSSAGTQNLPEDGDFGIVEWEDGELTQGEPDTLNEVQENNEPAETPSIPQYEESAEQYNPSEPQYNAYNPSEPQYNQNEIQTGDSWNYDAPQPEAGKTDDSSQDNNYGIPYAARTVQSAPESNKKVIAVAAVLGIICMFALVKLVTNMFIGSNTEKSQAQIEKTMQEAQQQMGDDFYKAASGENPEDAAIPTEGENLNNEDMANGAMNEADLMEAKQAPMPNETLVTVNLAANVGRVNPFLPMAGYAGYTSDLPKLPSAVGFPAPPTELTVNEPAIKLMETTISGIMFDAIAPSAIVKVEGKDHLVRKGDRINGYKILNITKDRVVVQNGTNVYRASVGETITTEQTGEVNFNTIDNLTRKFGGANAPKGTKMIQIN